MSYSKQNFRSGDTLYASQLNAMDEEIAVLEAEVESTKNMVGSPLTASTAAGMSDQTKIYVYTGTETGYTAGHWYYYNGTAWTDGGVYNSVAVNTDTSLTVPGQAADSKAVGDAIDDLDSDLSDVKSDLSQLDEEIKGETTTSSEPISVSFNTGYGLIANSSNGQYGKRYGTGGNVNLCSNFVNIEKYNAIDISMMKYTTASDFGIVFYSDNVDGNIPSNCIAGYVTNVGTSQTAEIRHFDIPAGAKYFRTAFRSDFEFSCTGYWSERSGGISGVISDVGNLSELETETKESIVSAINELTSQVEATSISIEEDIPVTFESSAGFINANANDSNFYGKIYSASNYMHSDFTSIEGYEYINITAFKTINPSDIGLVFYSDADVSNIPNNCVEGCLFNSGASENFVPETIKINIPQGAKYFRTSYRNNLPTFHCSGGREVAVNGINGLYSDVYELMNNPSGGGGSKSTLGKQWKYKTWYAYGTSITNTSQEGKYALYLAQMSGLLFVNKGISGGGIGNNIGGHARGQVYNAICNTTDGKLNADLITIETGANDTGADVPLGTIYDTGTSTLAGCLNDCIRYLLTNTHAQICVINSPATKTVPDVSNKYYEWAHMVEQICHINRVHFLSNDNNMGNAKLTSSDGNLYVVDNIHQTELGGFIMAQNLWYQLRNVPCFYKSIPQSTDDSDDTGEDFNEEDQIYDALTQLREDLSQTQEDAGSLSDLDTSDKSSLVGAINETYGEMHGGVIEQSDHVNAIFMPNGIIIANSSDSYYGKAYSISGSMQYSDYVNIEKYKKIEITMPKYVSETNAGIVFYSDNVDSNIPTNCIVGYKCNYGTSGSIECETRTFDIPTGAKYFRVTFRASFDFSCIGYYDKAVGGLGEIYETLDSHEDRIDSLEALSNSTGIAVKVVDFDDGVKTDDQIIADAFAFASNYQQKTIIFDTRDWNISTAILLESNTTVYIDGVKIKQNDLTFDNVFRGKNFVVDPNYPNQFALSVSATENIRIIGLNNAIIEGPDVNATIYNPYQQQTVPMIGDAYGWRAFQIYICDCDGLEISGLKITKTRNWAISFEFCKNGHIHDIDFDTTGVKNGDGIDLRIGCHHFRIHDITGYTKDDTVACTALYPGYNNSRYPSQTSPSMYPCVASRTGESLENTDQRTLDIHDVVISNIFTGGAEHGVICLCNNGLQVYNVGINNVAEEQRSSRGAVIMVYTGYGSSWHSGSYSDNDLHNISVGAIESNGATYAFQCNCKVANVYVNKLVQNKSGAEKYSIANMNGITITNSGD